MPAVSARLRCPPTVATALFAGLVAVLMAMTPSAAQSPRVLEAPPKVALCAGCHGRTGNSVESRYPILAGQTTEYLARQLEDFRDGRRRHEQMSAIAALLEPEEIAALADWFGDQPRWPTGFIADPVLLASGSERARELGCGACHRSDFRGNGTIPALAGQHAEYLIAQLLAFRSGARHNDGGVMGAIVPSLGEADMRDIAHYLATLAPKP